MANHPNRSNKLPINCTREDGKINDGVYVAYNWIIRDDGSRKLCRMYIGTKAAGPILQYDADGSHKWDGVQHRDYPHGAWTPLYSSGDYGKRYAFGGHWSGHTLNRLGYERRDINHGEQILLNGQFVPAPTGIKGDTEVTEIDCRGTWAIWYQSASEALDARLNPEQIQASDLPQKNKIHLGLNEPQSVINMVREVVEAHKI